MQLRQSDLNATADCGIYVHVPFCPHICPYCDFVKTSKFSRSQVQTFFEGVSTQLDATIDTATSHGFKTVTLYFGGGTPGLFPGSMFAPLVEKVARQFRIVEATIETNPYTNTEHNFEGYLKAGLNRVTLGVQSLDDAVLKFLGRRHSNAQALQNVKWARGIGFPQVQVDLIYGIASKGWTRNIEDEIRQLVDAGATGVSAYALTIEERTEFGSSHFDDEAEAQREYETILNTCIALGMKQVETSNFSFFEAEHNNIYWYGRPYFGIGTGAHGLLPSSAEHPFGQRYKVGVIKGERAPGDDDLFSLENSPRLFTIEHERPRTKAEYVDEMIFTLLRTPLGLSLPWLESHVAGVRAKIENDKIIQRGLEEGRLVIINNQLHIVGTEKLRGDRWCLQITSLLS